MKWTANTKVTGGAFLTALGILSFVQVVTYGSAVSWIEQARVRSTSSSFILENSLLLRALQDAETGQRGYIITGDEDYLQPYQKGSTQVGQHLKALRALATESPDQQKDLEGLEPLVWSKLAELQKALESRKGAGFEAAQAAILSGRSKAAMDKIRDVVAAMQAREEQRLRRLDAEVAATSRRTIVTLLVGSLLSIGLLVTAFYFLNSEIAERRRAEAGLRNANQELEVANKELEAFTYSVSHDLRSPLRHIDGFSKILVEEHASALSEEARHYLHRVREGSLRMGILIDDLLNLAGVGRKELAPQMVALGTIVKEIQAELKLDCENREVEWKVDPLPLVECDPALVKQVFANLLSNALKFTRTRPRATIKVGTQTVNGLPAIFVRDNGVGFSMKYAEKLFGVFQRLHRPEDFEGTGVGLATVKRIVHKHGGQVWAEAELDKGATFYFTLEGGKGERSENA